MYTYLPSVSPWGGARSYSIYPQDDHIYTPAATASKRNNIQKMSATLTHRGRVTHICVSKLCLSWLRWWLPNLNRCWDIIHGPIGNECQGKLDQNTTEYWFQYIVGKTSVILSWYHCVKVMMYLASIWKETFLHSATREKYLLILPYVIRRQLHSENIKINTLASMAANIVHFFI